MAALEPVPCQPVNPQLEGEDMKLKWFTHIAGVAFKGLLFGLLSIASAVCLLIVAVQLRALSDVHMTGTLGVISVEHLGNQVNVVVRSGIILPVTLVGVGYIAKHMLDAMRSSGRVRHW